MEGYKIEVFDTEEPGDLECLGKFLASVDQIHSIHTAGAYDPSGDEIHHWVTVVYREKMS